MIPKMNRRLQGFRVVKHRRPVRHGHGWMGQVLVLAIAGSTASCSQTMWEASTIATAAALAGYLAVESARPVGPARLMIYGGPNNGTYLGCLSCPSTDPESVFNEYGAGNPYRYESITNSYGQFGSPYSSYSACNEYASDPPVVVDEAGNYYGRLTLNRYAPDALIDFVPQLAALCQ